MNLHPATGFDLDTVQKLLSTTRSVRSRLDLNKAVPLEVIKDCLELALQAPTGSNAQTWRWVVISDPKTREALADIYRNPPAEPPTRHGTVLPTVERSPQQQRVEKSARFLVEHIHEVPLLVIPCVARAGGAAGWAPSIYPAVWSFILALRSRGLGSVITTVHLFREDEVAALLGIPDNYAQACMLPVAYYTGDDFKPAVRRPVEEVTFLNTWGHPLT